MKQKLTLLFTLMLSTLMASAHDIEVKNTDGVTIYYNYINNGTELAVTFGGSYTTQYSNRYQGKVDIPEEVTYMNRKRKVTSIGSGAFSGCSGLTSITIPNSVTGIETEAFRECSGLTSVTIPNSVASIGEYSFWRCKGLVSITIPNSVTSIGREAFYDCSSLTSVIIPNSVTTIGEWAFYGCSGLTSVIIPNSVTSIGALAFRSCYSLTSVTIPNSVTSIGVYAFAECKNLTSVTIPNSVTSIESGTFYNCSSLTSVTIPNSVTSIGEYAFDGADISTVVSLIENPFKIEGKTSSLRTFSQNTFNNAMLYIPVGTIEKYKVTDGWKDFFFFEEGDGPGGDTPETQKCSTPTISYENGKLTFSCDTEGATCQYSITDTDIKAGSGNEVQLTTTYKVTVYATKAGYENSDEATLEINVGGAGGIRGDVNLDGEVGMPDAMFIVNYVLNGKFPDEEEPMTYYYYAGWTLPTESNIETIINETLPENSGSSTLNNCGKKTTSKSSMDFSSNALYNVNGRDYYYVLVPEGQTIVDTENVDITENYTSKGTITIGNQSHVIYKSNMTTRYINDITIY